MEERIAPPWEPWEAIPVALAAYAATAVVSVMLALATGGIGGLAFQLTVMAFPVVLAASTLLWVSVRYRNGVPALRIPSRRTATDVVVGAFSGVALYALAVLVVGAILFLLLELLLGRPVSPPQQQVLPTADPTAVQLLLAAVAVAVAAPVGEEIFFRGFLFGSLRERFGFWASAIISSAVFAVVHVLPLLMPLLFVVGLGLALLYEWRRSLVPCMAAHAAFNLVGFSLILLR